MKLKNNLYILMIMTFLSCGENAPIQCFTPQDPRLQNRSGDIMNDLYKYALPLDKALRANDIDDDEVTGSSHLRQISQELNASRSKLWKDRRINVCWINPSNDPAEKELREAIRQKIADTWEEALFIDDSKNIKFTDWGRCTSVNDKQIRIMIEDVRPRSKVGTDLADRSKKRPWISLNFIFKSFLYETCSLEKVSQTAYKKCVLSVATHEFGHALGLAHEQNREDTDLSLCPAGIERDQVDDDTTIGPWDKYSIMNYCNPFFNNNGKLSDLDIQGIRALYFPEESNIYCVESEKFKEILKSHPKQIKMH